MSDERERIARIIHDGLDDGMGSVAPLEDNLECDYIDVGSVDLGVVADTILSRGEGTEAVAWASEWQGIGGPSRAFHYCEEDAIDNAKWMEGRAFPLYAHPAGASLVMALEKIANRPLRVETETVDGTRYRCPSCGHAWPIQAEPHHSPDCDRMTALAALSPQAGKDDGSSPDGDTHRVAETPVVAAARAESRRRHEAGEGCNKCVYCIDLGAPELCRHYDLALVVMEAEGTAPSTPTAGDE